MKLKFLILITSLILSGCVSDPIKQELWIEGTEQDPARIEINSGVPWLPSLRAEGGIISTLNEGERLERKGDESSIE